ncbi:inorganic phosphate transporter [Haliscomenobacter sp.]|uniref:inorganic phosphate transporter n=1 Tax=Haliscomenobacter sp. TaxID=2717303 RepID=UPI00336509E1
MNVFDLSLLSSGGAILLILFIIAVLAFEFVNGFHDTANAVATVIYTNSLKPTIAVVWSGIFNFLGVITGGVGVAMGIVKLLPVNDMMSMPLFESASIVAAVLLAAIFWNLGTWYLGIPCSSSHTLIGSLLGVGIVFFWTHGGEGVNWGKAQEIGLALLFSPLFGCFAALMLMWILAKIIKNKAIFEEPERGKTPPTWIRAILITTCTLVSFFHGSNDGQKGVGLFMIVLMIFLPTQFALHKSFDADAVLTTLNKVEVKVKATEARIGENQAAEEVLESIEKLKPMLVAGNLDRPKIRKELQRMTKYLKETTGDRPFFNKSDKEEVKATVKSLTNYFEFAPRWVVFCISIALGLGTMIGWKRIVVTIGEKIGKTHLTYAQGATAELIGASTIALSTVFHAPVSTTHVLSSAIAGTMMAKDGHQNLQRSTLINILTAWILTLPVTIIVSGGLYYLFTAIFG